LPQPRILIRVADRFLWRSAESCLSRNARYRPRTCDTCRTHRGSVLSGACCVPRWEARTTPAFRTLPSLFLEELPAVSLERPGQAVRGWRLAGGSYGHPQSDDWTICSNRRRLRSS